MLEREVESIVLAMWDEPPEEMAREVMTTFDIGYDQAIELVLEAITREEDFQPDEAQEWHDFDPDC